MGAALATIGWVRETIDDYTQLTPGIVTQIQLATSDGGHNLIHPIGATRLRNDMVVVGDAATLTVRYFDHTGKLHYTAGSRGRGPGQFMSLSWIGRCYADSVLAFDFVLHRVTVLGGHGEFERSFSVDGNPAIVTCSHDSDRLAFLARPASLPRLVSDGYRVQTELEVADGDGHVVRDLGLVPAYEVDSRLGPLQPRPLGRLTSLAIAAGRLYIGNDESGAVTMISLTSAATGSVWIGDGSHKVSPTNVVRSISAMSLIQPDSTSRRRAMIRLSRASPPLRTPPYTSLLSDPAGSVWAVISAPGDKETDLQSVDSRGLVHRIAIPADLTVYEVGTDFILGLRWDDSEPVAVTVYQRRRNRTMDDKAHGPPADFR